MVGLGGLEGQGVFEGSLRGELRVVLVLGVWGCLEGPQ